MQVEKKNLDLLTAKEDLENAQKETEKVKERIKALKRQAALPSSEREEELQKEIARRDMIVKCTTCRQDVRSVILTKCSHSTYNCLSKEGFRRLTMPCSFLQALCGCTDSK